MSRKRSLSRGKKINPKYWVFCEGETEEAYINFLRQKYRIPIEIKLKVSGNKINEGLIKRTLKGQPSHDKDKIFLMYDADIQDIVNRVLSIPETLPLLSNPTIELWFLLHCKNQTAFISQEDCIKEISKRNKVKYKKGLIDSRLKEKLDQKTSDACRRAKTLSFHNNPSSNIYKFIELLESH